jgi:uncharacterized SAM-binding protein YcdF (DUF218 family)
LKRHFASPGTTGLYWAEEALLFILGKIVDILASPGNLIVLGLLLGTPLLWLAPRMGRFFVLLVTLFCLAIAFSPLDQWMSRPLEERFPHPASLPADIGGIVLLGGFQNQLMQAARGVPEVNSTADRLLAFVRLARTYPRATLVASGGSGDMLRPGLLESNVTREVMDWIGFDASRVTFEDRSRSTYENALYTRRIVPPEPGRPLIIIFSAMSMPRAVGVFRAQGYEVVPFPVDYMTYPKGFTTRLPNFESRLRRMERAVHEWLGLVAYRVLGYSREFLPAPAGSDGGGDG